MNIAQTIYQHVKTTTNKGKKMNAVEFQTTVHNGVITLPGNQQSWNGKKIKVILLDETSPDTTEIS